MPVLPEELRPQSGQSKTAYRRLLSRKKTQREATACLGGPGIGICAFELSLLGPIASRAPLTHYDILRAAARRKRGVLTAIIAYESVASIERCLFSVFLSAALVLLRNERRTNISAAVHYTLSNFGIYSINYLTLHNHNQKIDTV